ncbi:acyl carrier protein [Amycolatopsis sp. lyj-23]|uniref:acyl carrier protein n=1 Tax=Amycolatopsis sp. lyj-23 TaxID=2789283 RepID=UPI0039794380
MSSPSLASIEEFVRTWLRTLDTVSEQAPDDLMLVDIGLDSLDVVELSRSLRQAGIQVKPTDLDSYDTLAETIVKIHQLAQPG